MGLLWSTQPSFSTYVDQRSVKTPWPRWCLRRAHACKAPARRSPRRVKGWLNKRLTRFSWLPALAKTILKVCHCPLALHFAWVQCWPMARFSWVRARWSAVLACARVEVAWRLARARVCCAVFFPWAKACFSLAPSPLRVFRGPRGGVSLQATPSLRWLLAVGVSFGRRVRFRVEFSQDWAK